MTAQLHPCGTAVELCTVHRRPVYYYFLTPWPVGEPYHEYVCEVGHIVRLVLAGAMPEQLSLLEMTT